MKRILILMLTALLLLGAVLPAGAAEPLDSTVAAVQRALDESLGSETPGAAVLVMKAGETLMLEGFGYADLEARQPVLAETVFELGELSSAFVAVVAVAMAEEGRLDLDESIATYLPAAFMKRLKLTYPVTLRQLLLGRAGFGGRIHDVYFSSEAFCFAELSEALLADVPDQIAPPDTCTLYSAFGTALAAYVLSVVAKAPYENLAQQYVFTPLGMAQTTYRLPGQSLAEAATGYTSTGSERFEEGSRGGVSYSGLYPATGAVSSITDLSFFLQFLLSDAPSPVLSAAGKAELLQVVESGVIGGSTLCFSVQNGAVGRVGHTLCHGASLYMDSTQKRAALVLTNTADNPLLSLPLTLCSRTSVRAPGTEEGLYDLELLEGIYASAAGETRTFVGRFTAANSNCVAEINEDGTLQFLDMRLRQSAPGVFVLAEGDDATVKVQFFLDYEGKVALVTAADGSAYMPVPFYLSYSVATLLLAALMLGSLWCFLYGVGVLVHWRHHREQNGKHRSLQYIFPHVFAAIQGLAVILSVCVGGYFGTAVYAPFYSTLSVIALLFGIAASITYVVAFLRSFFRRALHHRIAYSAIFFVLYQVLIRLWALVPV